MRTVLKIEDLIGTKYSRLTILGEGEKHVEPNGKGQRTMVCKCDCGKTTNKQLKDLRKGIAKSCGCIHKEKIIKITPGDVYSYWTVIKEVDPYITADGSKMKKVEAQCICGKIKNVLLNTIRQENSKSCGCMTDHSEKMGKRSTVESPIPDISIEQLQKRVKGDWTVLEIVSAERNEKTEIVRTIKMQCKCGYEKVCKTETMSDSSRCSECANKLRLEKYSDEERIIRNRLSSVYGSMSSRCNNPNSKDYKNYGGRRIQIEESFKPFQKFYDWAIDNGYTVDCKLEVDRENNDGNYSVSNCRLVSKKENNRNMRRNVMNWELVNKIRIGEWKDFNNCEIARLIGCSDSNVRSVRNNEIWVE